MLGMLGGIYTTHNVDLSSSLRDASHREEEQKAKKHQKKCSVTGNRTPVSRVTGGDTSHYTMTDLLHEDAVSKFILSCG